MLFHAALGGPPVGGHSQEVRGTGDFRPRIPFLPVSIERLAGSAAECLSLSKELMQ